MEEKFTDPIMMKPTEVELRALRVREYVTRIQSYGENQLGYNPIPVIKEDGYYLMGEGHHTSGGIFLLDRPIKICILETDKDVRNCNFGYFKDFSDRDSLRADLLRLRRIALSRGIDYLEDLPVKFSHDDRPCLGDEGLYQRIMQLELNGPGLSQQNLVNMAFCVE